MVSRLKNLALKYSLFLIFLYFLTPTHLSAFTANTVRFEQWPHGVFRIYMNYTVPELQEFREAFVEFYKREEAEAFYWDVVRGADVYLNNPGKREFKNQIPTPQPW